LTPPELEIVHEHVRALRGCLYSERNAISGLTRVARNAGSRLAIGADRAQVMAMILKQGMTLAGAGIGVGVAAAFLLARLMQSLLYQVKPGDPGTFLIVPVVLVVVALLASLLPAFRATRVSPLIALRSE
jgi:putative ABC transport system permease protein